MSDVEKNDEEPRDGTQALAAFIARDPDCETFVYRRFAALTARNLLHLQCELADLERQLGVVELAARGSGDPALVLSLRNWETLRSQAKERDGEERKILQLMEEIEVKLEKYHDALLRSAEITHLRTPSQRVLEACRHEVKHMKLRGSLAEVFESETDLVALRPPPDKDLLSTVIRDHWVGPKTSVNSHTFHFRASYVDAVGSLSSVIIATASLVGSILTLYFVTTPNLRLGLLLMFIILFAIGMRVCTSASRDSLFAGTAAYAAVLIVFVSGNLGNVPST